MVFGGLRMGNELLGDIDPNEKFVMIRINGPNLGPTLTSFLASYVALSVIASIFVVGNIVQLPMALYCWLLRVYLGPVGL